MLRLKQKSSRTRRAGFSLAELVISVGILILMMALAGQVFSITIKSTGQATALTEVTQQLRVFEDTLREDLRSVQPGQSVMLIQGNPINAYWTQAGKDADDDIDPSNGYGHVRDLEREKFDTNGVPVLQNGYEVMQEPRADILMFFTARKATSATNPAVSSRVQQVVYGHAEMGEYQPDASTSGNYAMVPDIAADPASGNFPVDPGTLYPILGSPAKFPANQWHLARRSVLVLPVASPVPSPNDPIRLDDSRFLDSQQDFFWNFSYDQFVLKPQLNGASQFIGAPWYLPQIFGDVSQAYANWWKPFLRSRMDLTPPMMMANRMGAYFLPNCASFKVEWSLDPHSTFVNGRLDRTNEIFWFDHGHDADTPSDVSDDDPLAALRARVEQLRTSGVCTNESNPQYQLCRDLSSLLCEQTFHGDDWPPASTRSGYYSLADRFVGRTCDPIGKPPSDPSQGKWDQFASGGARPNTATFTALRPGVTEPLVPDDIWPGALRITVDLYDRESRLERPIRHVMVIPIGE